MQARQGTFPPALFLRETVHRHVGRLRIEAGEGGDDFAQDDPRKALKHHIFRSQFRSKIYLSLTSFSFFLSISFSNLLFSFGSEDFRAFLSFIVISFPFKLSHAMKKLLNTLFGEFPVKTLRCSSAICLRHIRKHVFPHIFRYQM